MAAKDLFCAAGKRRFCKHVAALAYKLVEATRSECKQLPKPISGTQVCQQWGIPSFKASQDPEKEVIKRQPLHEIMFEKNILSRDKSGGRKRKCPVEVNTEYSSRPKGEPAVDTERIEKLCDDLAASKCPKMVSEILELNLVKVKDDECVILDNSVQLCKEKENVNDGRPPVTQKGSEWFTKRIGKVTSSKRPSVIGLQGKREFLETWDCIKNKKTELSKRFRNYERGIKFEAEAAENFAVESTAAVYECGVYCLESDQNYGVSPDGTFRGETCRSLKEVKTGRHGTLCGLCLLEIQTRAEGNLEPLASVTGAHVAQVQLQQECVPVNACILQSYVSENKNLFPEIFSNTF